jgi:hypothetical protein
MRNVRRRVDLEEGTQVDELLIQVASSSEPISFFESQPLLQITSPFKSAPIVL